MASSSTVKRAAAKKKPAATDLDSLLGLASQTEDHRPTIKMKLFGQEWDIVTTIDAYTQLGLSQDTLSEASLKSLIDGLVKPEDLRRWREAWSKFDFAQAADPDDFDDDPSYEEMAIAGMFKVVSSLIEAVGKDRSSK
jgi:hypothetical protein